MRRMGDLPRPSLRKAGGGDARSTDQVLIHPRPFDASLKLTEPGEAMFRRDQACARPHLPLGMPAEREGQRISWRLSAILDEGRRRGRRLRLGGASRRWRDGCPPSRRASSSGWRLRSSCSLQRGLRAPCRPRRLIGPRRAGNAGCRHVADAPARAAGSRPLAGPQRVRAAERAMGQRRPGSRPDFSRRDRFSRLLRASRGRRGGAQYRARPDRTGARLQRRCAPASRGSSAA